MLPFTAPHITRSQENPWRGPRKKEKKPRDPIEDQDALACSNAFFLTFGPLKSIPSRGSQVLF